MEQYIISVIITVYNSAKYLEECLDSVCNQTYRNLEIILIDDGSTDLSPKICDTYANSDSRIQVIHKENEGVVVARKKGISLVKGDFVSIIDSDDYLELNMLEKLLRAAVDNDCEVSMCGRYEETEEYSIPVFQGLSEGVYDKKHLLDKVYPKMISNGHFFGWGLFPSMWDKLFKRELIIEHINNVNDNLPMGNDAAVVYPCLLSANSIFILKECLYHYRQNNLSISKLVTDFSKTRNGFKLLYNSVRKLLQDNSFIFDCQRQWLEYVIFLLIAKFDCLVDELSNIDYLFPFEDVKSGSKIVIYGMGTYGKRLYNYINQTNICELVTGIDREYDSLSKAGYRVDCIDNIEKYDYDYIIIAVTYARTKENILKCLDGKCDLGKIRVIDEKVLSNDVLVNFLKDDK